MTTKKLLGRQARQAELLSRYYFKLKYRVRRANKHANTLSRKTEDVQEQQKATKRYQTQIMIPRNKIDQAIIDNLNLNSQNSVADFLDPAQEINNRLQGPALIGKRQELAFIALEEEQGYNSLRLIGRILEDNKTSPKLQELRIKALVEQSDNTQILRDRLLLRSRRLYVTEGTINKTLLRTVIIREAYAQPLSGHLGGVKLKQLISLRYYQLGQGSDIDQYCANCYACRRAHVPRDKKPGFLHQLLVPDRPQQHITVDFKKCLESRAKHNIVAIFVDRLGKRPITIPVRDTITVRELVPLFLLHVVRYVGLPDSITSDHGPQFVLDFWNKVYHRLGIKIKLSTTNYPQTDRQTEIVNQYFNQRLRLYINYYQDDQDKQVAMINY